VVSSSPLPLPPPGVVGVRAVSFNLNPSYLNIPAPQIKKIQRPILRPTRYGLGPLSLNPVPSEQGVITPSSVLPNSVSLVEQHDSILENFSSTLQFHCGDDEKVPISTLYSQFSDCKSFSDVVLLSREIAPCAFDVAQALEAHRANPLFLDHELIRHHTQQVSAIGLVAVLQQASAAVMPITLQPAVVMDQFANVSTYENLLRIATNGVTTSLHSSFVANNGFNCPQYDETISHPAIIAHLLSKGHRSGRFVIIPLAVGQSAAAREQQVIHSSTIFPAAKRDSKIGRMVVNFSVDGPNHLSKKDSLPLQYGKINSPQLGLICQLVENAHRQFPHSAATLGGIRVDIDAAYHRMRYSVESSLLCSTQILIDGVVYLVFSTVALMGDQDVNYCFNQVTVAVAEAIAAFISAETGTSLELSSAYVDDFFAFGDQHFLDVVHDKLGLLIGDGRSPGLCSHGSAINHSKDIRGTVVETLGWLFNVPLKLVQPNYLTYAKLVYNFFVAVGDTPVAGQRISVRLLMVLGAHAMRASNIITPLLGHSRSFHYNIRGNCDPSAFVRLNQLTVDDIYLWRCLLRLSFTDARVLSTPTYAPLLRMKVSPDEPLSARGIRSAQRADIIGYSDACTGTFDSLSTVNADAFPGIGGYIPGLAYFGARYSELSTMCLVAGTSVSTNINILELLALIATATLAIQQLQSMQSSTGCHIHIYCDNMSAISKCRTHRSTHPVYMYLLHQLSLLQLRNRCTVGTGFVKGRDNPVADAISRAFLVPGSHRIFHRHLSHLPYKKLSEASIETMRCQLLLLPPAGSRNLQPLPMSLVGDTFSPSLPPMAYLSPL
jgi:hypothetical protein